MVFSTVRLDGITDDVHSYFKNLNGLILDNKDDFLVYSRIAYRKKPDSAAMSVAFGGFELYTEASQVVIEKWREIKLSLDHEKCVAERKELDLTRFDDRMQEITLVFGLLEKDLNKKKKKADLLSEFGRNQSKADIAFSMANLMEKHYPIIVTTLEGLICGTKTLIGFYRREIEYIQRTNYQPLETTKSVPLNGFRFTEDRIDGEKTIILPADLAKAQKRKSSKKPKKR